MAGLMLTDGNKDYFKEPRLKRQQQLAERVEIGVGSSTPIAKATIPIPMVSTPNSTRPPINPKKRKEEHGKDRGRSSRRHGERSSRKSPKGGRVAGGQSHLTPISWVTTCKWPRRSPSGLTLTNRMPNSWLVLPKSMIPSWSCVCTL